jgi:molybdopterin/thiamine biosynthesis adenylyltransferase
VAAGGCGGCGLTADPNLMAMGIESFFFCSLLILHGLQKTEKSENRN